MTHKVHGTGSIDVNVSAPPGTAVKSQFGGLFKKHAVHRQTQMAPAQGGPMLTAEA
jgi:GTPase involved in cell partitioning and DNA repair